MNEESVEAIAIGLSLFGFVGLAALALLLGIIGLCQRDRKKSLAVAGTIISALTLVGVAVLVLAGMAMQ